MPLTVCPLSNLKLRVFHTLAQHNIGTMLDAGIVATVNSRRPGVLRRLPERKLHPDLCRAGS